MLVQTLKSLVAFSLSSLMLYLNHKTSMIYFSECIIGCCLILSEDLNLFYLSNFAKFQNFHNAPIFGPMTICLYIRMFKVDYGYISFNDNISASKKDPKTIWNIPMELIYMTDLAEIGLIHTYIYIKKKHGLDFVYRFNFDRLLTSNLYFLSVSSIQA